MYVPAKDFAAVLHPFGNINKQFYSEEVLYLVGSAVGFAGPVLCLNGFCFVKRTSGYPNSAFLS